MIKLLLLLLLLCRLCGDRDETINLIISECNKLAQVIRLDTTGWAR